jgi:hypothetical protein
VLGEKLGPLHSTVQGIPEGLAHQRQDLSHRMPTSVSDDQLSDMTQRSISLEVDFSLKALSDQDAVTVRDKARIRSLSASHARDWLIVVPLPALGLHWRPREFKFAVAYRLGIPLYLEDGVCPACQRPSNKYGDHSVACAYTGECVVRHNHLRDALFKVAQAAGLAPTKEKQALIPGTNGRPADVLVSMWGQGHCFQHCRDQPHAGGHSGPRH